MKGLRIIKKSKYLYKSVQSQSRQIITNIYNNGIETDKLELNLKQWSSQHVQTKAVVQNPTVKVQQPLKNLLLLLQHLSNQFYIEICSFIFLSKDFIHVVFKDKYITIKKIKNEKSKLKYWFSHIYFTRLRNKLAESLLEENFNAGRDVIHYNEEKEYMPSHVSGPKKLSILVRQIKISRSSIDRKHGEGERQQFCVGYFNNGTEQLFSFSQVLSFVQYPFNLSQISYFKILNKQRQVTNIVTTFYQKKRCTMQQVTMIEKLKRIIKKQQRWMMIKDECQELKNNFIKNEQYESYSNLQMLEIISFLQVKMFIEVTQLKLQWTISLDKSVILSNASIYKFVSLNKLSDATDGLITLYQKCQTNRYKNKSNEEQDTFQRFKKIKSEQKQLGNRPMKLPILQWRNKSKEKQISSLLRIKNKANSCVLRIGLSGFNS